MAGMDFRTRMGGTRGAMAGAGSRRRARQGKVRVSAAGVASKLDPTGEGPKEGRCARDEE